MRMGSASTTCTTRRWAPRPTWPSVSACAPPSRTIPTKPSSSPASANRGSSTVPTTATTPCVEPAGCARGTTPSAACASSSCSPSALVRHYAVSAVGADRPGIVAAVTGVFLEHGCNLEDTSMTILRGHFAMMLVVAAPDGLEQAALESALSGPASDFELVVAVRAIDDDVPSSPDGESWTVSVYGA